MLMIERADVICGTNSEITGVRFPCRLWLNFRVWCFYDMHATGVCCDIYQVRAYWAKFDFLSCDGYGVAMHCA